MKLAKMLFSILLISSTSYAGGHFKDIKFKEIKNDIIKPSIGIDFLSHSMEFKEDMGRNHFKSRHLPLYHINAHLHFTDHLGVEFGFSQVKQTKNTKHLHAGEMALGVQTQYDELHKFIYGIKSSHVGLRYDYPLSFIKIEGFKVPSLFAVVGIVNHRLTVKDTIFMHNGILQSPPLERNFSKRKTVLRLSGGLKMDINDHFGVRALVTFENTNRIKQVKPDERKDSPMSVGTRNTLGVGMGIYFNI